MLTQYSGLGTLANAQNVLITGGNFVSISRSLCGSFGNCPYVTAENYYTVNNSYANTGEAQTKIPILHKPNPSSLFTGRNDVLDKLGKIFVNRMNSKPRRSRLL